MRAYPSMLVALLVTIMSLSCTADPMAIREPWPVATLSVEPTSAVIPVGASIELTATPRDPTGAPFVGLPTTWTTSNASTATVGDGIVHGMAAGSVEIIATVEGKRDTAVITITPSPAAPPPPSRPICDIAPADGHAAITAAIAGCPNGSTVVFPPNASYTIIDRIEVKNRTDLIIDGNGSTFTNIRPITVPAGVPKPVWWLETDTDLSIKNMTVIGNFTNAATLTRPGNDAYAPGPVWNNIQWEHGFTVVSGNGIWITDVTVNNVWGEFVCTQPVAGLEGRGGEPRNVHIERLTGSGGGRNGVAFVACIDCWLENSTLSNAFLMGIDLEADVPNELVQNIHIIDVAINGVYGSPVIVPFKFAPGQIANIEVRGLTMSDAPDTCYGPVQVGYPEDQTNTTVIYGVVVENSQLKSKRDGLVLKDVGSGSVSNNTITAIGSTAFCGARVPVKLINSSGVVVSANTAVGY